MQQAKIGNTNALKYKSAKELETAINKYFDMCDEQDKPYTISGLCLALGIDRSTLLRYSGRDSYATLIKNAKLKVQTMLEENLYRLGNNSGIIFNLKNNYGWKDSVEVTDNHELSKVQELLTKLEQEAKDDSE